MEDAQTAELSWVLPLAIALIPALGGFLAALVQRQSGSPRALRFLTHMTEALSKTPDGSSSRAALDKLTATYVKSIESQFTTKRTPNAGAVVGVIILAIISAAIMFLLSSWILVAGDLAVIAWTVTIVVGLFVLFINAAAWVAAAQMATTRPL